MKKYKLYLFDFAGILHGKTAREVLESYNHVAVMDSLEELLETD